MYQIYISNIFLLYISNIFYTFFLHILVTNHFLIDFENGQKLNQFTYVNIECINIKQKT